MAGKRVRPVRRRTICIGMLADFVAGPDGKERPSSEFCAASALPPVRMRSKKRRIRNLAGIPLDFCLSGAIVLGSGKRIAGTQERASMRVSAEEERLLAGADEVYLVRSVETDTTQDTQTIAISAGWSNTKSPRPH